MIDLASTAGPYDAAIHHVERALAAIRDLPEMEYVREDLRAAREQLVIRRRVACQQARWRVVAAAWSGEAPTPGRPALSVLPGGAA